MCEVLDLKVNSNSSIHHYNNNNNISLLCMLLSCSVIFWETIIYSGWFPSEMGSMICCVVLWGFSPKSCILL